MMTQILTMLFIYYKKQEDYIDFRSYPFQINWMEIEEDETEACILI